MGGFALALDPSAFIPTDVYGRIINTYMANIRQAAAAADATGTPMAPGTREWAVEAGRLENGIPVDPDTARAFRETASAHGLTLPTVV
eukprot:gene51390-68782_t